MKKRPDVYVLMETTDAAEQVLPGLKEELFERWAPLFAPERVDLEAALLESYAGQDPAAWIADAWFWWLRPVVTDFVKQSAPSLPSVVAAAPLGHRYSHGRDCLNWSATDYLKITKMLAWVIKQREQPTEGQLWARLVELFPSVVERVTGEAGVTFDSVIEDTRRSQGLEITALKLTQRADKAERYGEFNDRKDAVLAAYQEVRS